MVGRAFDKLSLSGDGRPDWRQAQDYRIEAG